MITLEHGLGLGCNDYFITKGSVKNVRKDLWITSLDFNYVKPCLDLVQLELQLLTLGKGILIF